jgi:hypothetical protein
MLRLQSIRSNLTAIVLLAIMPALAIILYSGLEERRRAIEEARQDVLLLTHSMAESQQEFSRSVRQVLTTLALVPQVQEMDLDRCGAIFRGMLEQHPSYLNIALTDPRGRVVAAGQPLRITDLSDRKHIRGAIEKKGFAVGEFIMSRTGAGTPAFAFAYPVMDARKRISGVLTAAIRLSKYSEFHHVSNLPDKSFIAVTDHQGLRLFYYPPNDATNAIGQPIKQTS